MGMQPTCRHVPPRKPSFSTTKVFNPHCAARIAVLYPPGPLPMMTRSYLAKRFLRGWLERRTYCMGSGYGLPLKPTQHGWKLYSSPPKNVEKQSASAHSHGFP